MIKLIIFDFDDTLVDSKEASYENHTKIMKHLKIKPVSKEKYFALYGLAHEKLIKKLYPKINYSKYKKDYQTIFDEKKFKLFPNTLSTIKYLHKKYKLAIMTTKEEWKLRKIIKHHKLEKYFDYIHTPQNSKYAKPSIKAFDEVLQHFKLKKDEVAYIGDLDSDRDFSLKAEIFFVGLSKDKREGFCWTDSIEKLKNVF